MSNPASRRPGDNGACFIVSDGAGQKLAYVYFGDERADGRQPKLLTRDKACPLRSVFEGGQDCKSRFHSSRPVLMNQQSSSVTTSNNMYHLNAQTVLPHICI